MSQNLFIVSLIIDYLQARQMENEQISLLKFYKK